MKLLEQDIEFEVFFPLFLNTVVNDDNKIKKINNNKSLMTENSIFFWGNKCSMNIDQNVTEYKNLKKV